MRKITKYWTYSQDLGRMAKMNALSASVNYALFKNLPTSPLLIENPRMGRFHCRENTTDFMYSFYAYEYRIKNLIAAVKDEFDTFFDVGACIGDYSVWLANQGYDVVSFEPQPDNYQSMMHNLELNELSGAVQTFNFGLGNQSEEVVFCSHPENRGYTGKYAKHENGESCSVSIKTLDQLLESKQFAAGRKVIMKLDAEGMELEIIKGAKQFIDACKSIMLIFEFHQDQRNITNYLKRHYGANIVQVDALNAAVMI